MKPTPALAATAKHGCKKLLLMLLLWALVGSEFLESGVSRFAAIHIADGVDAAPREFTLVLASMVVESLS